MASKHLPLILLPFLFLLISQTQADADAEAPAPTPTPSSSVDLTAILENGGEYTTLISLLKEFQLLSVIQSQLSSTSLGFTLFAPTNRAFQHLNTKIFDDLTHDLKVKLLLYHVVPKFYTLSDLTTVTNPVKTLASDKHYLWGLNFADQGNQVQVFTGVFSTQIRTPLTQQFPLAVYPVDRVLLAVELFGGNPPSF